MRRLVAIGMTIVIAVAAGVLADGFTSAASSWSADPFPVEGWMVELASPVTCTPPEGQVDCTPPKDDMLLIGPCVQRFEHDYPDWTADGCGAQRSFVDGVHRVVEYPGGEVYEWDHGDGSLAPNPWFAPAFDAWQGPTVAAGELTLYPRELVYGGADVIGLDADGIPVLYVQRNQEMLERVSVFVRAQTGGGFPTAEEVAVALELAGLPDAEFAAALVSERRIAAARRHFAAP